MVGLSSWSKYRDQFKAKDNHWSDAMHYISSGVVRNDAGKSAPHLSN
jgi:hypothetical protein